MAALETSEREFTLVELLNILVAKRWIVMGVTVVTIIFAVLYLVVAKKEFACTAQILVGQIGKGQMVKNPTILVQELIQKYRVNDKTIANNFPRVSSVNLDKRESNSILLLEVLDLSPEGAKVFLSQIVNEILLEEKELFDQSMKINHSRLVSLTEQITLFDGFKRELDAHIEKTRNLDFAQAAILAVEKGKFLEAISDLSQKRYVLQLETSKIDSYPAQLLGEPRLPVEPIRPQKLLILLLSALAGLMMGMIGAVLSMVVNNVRR